MTETRKPGLVFWMAVALLFMFVLYAASIGPAFYLLVKVAPDDESRISADTFQIVYAPLYLLSVAAKDTPFAFFDDLFRRYLRWWADLAAP